MHSATSSLTLAKLIADDMNPWLLSIPLAYLLGSIPFGYLLVKIFMKQDIRATGSGNIGATNVARSGAKGLAIATLLLDAAKGYLAVFLAAWLAPTKPWLTAYWLLGNSNSSGAYTFYSPSNPLIFA